MASELTIKDFIPLVGTVITVTMGYMLISVQINKNRRSKWIEDFRKEIANFFSIATQTSKDPTIDNSYEMLQSVTTLILYLYDANEPIRRELVEKLRELQRMITNRMPEDIGTDEGLEFAGVLGKKLAGIMTLASNIILIEQRKI